MPWHRPEMRIQDVSYTVPPSVASSFVLLLYHAKLLNCGYRIARFLPFGKGGKLIFRSLLKSLLLYHGKAGNLTKQKRRVGSCQTRREGFSLKTQRNATVPLSGRAGARLRDRKGFPPQLRASSAAFCRSVMSMVHRAFRSASPPESPAISVRVLPLRASQKPSLCSYHSLPNADAPRIP